MATTIQVSANLKNALAKRRFTNKDTYEEIIWDLLEDTMALSEQTKRNIAVSRKQYARGEYYSSEEVKKKLGL